MAADLLDKKLLIKFCISKSRSMFRFRSLLTVVVV